MWFLSSVNLGMTLQVMLPNEALIAVIAAPLPISKVSLHVRSNVFFAPKKLVASVVSAHVLVVIVWTYNVHRNLVLSDSGLFVGSVNVHCRSRLRPFMRPLFRRRRVCPSVVSAVQSWKV